MDPKVRQALDRVFSIEQDATSEKWNSTVERALPGSLGSWADGEPEAINRVVAALLQLIVEKADHTTEGSRKVFESHRDYPTEDEQAELEQIMQRVLTQDISYATTLLEKIPGYQVHQRKQPITRLQEKGARDVVGAVHRFSLMLVDQRHRHSDSATPTAKESTPDERQPDHRRLEAKAAAHLNVVGSGTSEARQEATTAEVFSREETRQSGLLGMIFGRKTVIERATGNRRQSAHRSTSRNWWIGGTVIIAFSLVAFVAVPGPWQQEEPPPSQPSSTNSGSNASAATRETAPASGSGANSKFAAAAAVETKDFGVAPTPVLRGDPMNAPTPTQIQGGMTISTEALHTMTQQQETRFIVLDVLGGERGLPGAQNAQPAGNAGTFYDSTQRELGNYLQQATQGRRDIALIFYCQNNHCWRSYNAALRAIQLGYTRVYWYRGGIEAWTQAGLPTFPRQ